MCHRFSFEIAVGPGKTPTPSAPNALSKALSSKSASQAWPNVELREPPFEGASEQRVGGRCKERRVVERLWEPLSILARQRLGREERGP